MIGCKKAAVMNPPLESVPLTFTRVGETFGWDGRSIPEHTPIYEHKVPDGAGYKIVPGCGIFESRVNILPAAISQSMTEAYTTPALTGTYTFMVQGTGSITLSGGATDTINFGNHVTVTLSNATVTLTPTGTVTLVQVINKAYPLPWGLGGVSIQNEILTAPSSVLNIDVNGYSNLLTENQSKGISGWTQVRGNEALIPNNVEQFHEGTSSVKVTTPNIVTGEGTGTGQQSNIIAGIQYTVSGWVYAPNGQAMRLEYRNISGTVNQSVNFTGTGDWKKVSSTLTTTNTENLYIWIITNSKAGINFWVDEFQFSATSTVKPWIPGGTQVNTSSGTIEMECIMPYTVTGQGYLLAASSSSGGEYRNSIRAKNSNGILTFSTGDNNNQVSSSSVYFTVGLNKICCAFGSETAAFKNGVKATPVQSPKLPVEFNNIAIGRWSQGTQMFINGIIRNVVTSWQKRADADITARASLPEGQAPRADRGTMLYAPLMNNLKAYRVRA